MLSGLSSSPLFKSRIAISKSSALRSQVRASESPHDYYGKSLPVPAKVTPSVTPSKIIPPSQVILPSQLIHPSQVTLPDQLIFPPQVAPFKQSMVVPYKSTKSELKLIQRQSNFNRLIQNASSHSIQSIDLNYALEDLTIFSSSMSPSSVWFMPKGTMDVDYGMISLSEGHILKPSLPLIKNSAYVNLRDSHFNLHQKEKWNSIQKYSRQHPALSNNSVHVAIFGSERNRETTFMLYCSIIATYPTVLISL